MTIDDESRSDPEPRNPVKRLSQIGDSLVVVCDEALPPMSLEDVREVLERVRSKEFYD
jgi:hypothetical protein